MFSGDPNQLKEQYLTRKLCDNILSHSFLVKYCYDVLQCKTLCDTACPGLDTDSPGHATLCYKGQYRERIMAIDFNPDNI